jgi:hypothetical protein
MNHEAIYALYQQVAWVDDGLGPHDKDGNKVEIDTAAVAIKTAELEAAEQAKIQAAVDAKQSALAKLAALGLTQNEIKAIVG